MSGHECFFKIEKVILTRIGSDFECSMQNEADALFSIQILSRVVIEMSLSLLNEVNLAVESYLISNNASL